jgi:hypothetical protein
MAKSGDGACLNCGADLRGRFCSDCGQRAMPPYPTMRELVGDGWRELSGYDGRFARTFRLLLGRPGALTVAVLEGRRARYVTPLRLYLVASVLYFLVAAAAPNLAVPPAPVIPGSKINIDLTNPGEGLALSPEQRDEVLKSIERAPWFIGAALRSVVLNPADFRARFLRNLPRTLFVLVPVFAAIVALFYRRRGFAQHLIFALHLHAAVFIALTVRELANFTRSVVMTRVIEIAISMVILWYALVAFRRVYSEKWRWVVVKSAGIAGMYFVAGLLALVATFAWAALI